MIQLNAGFCEHAILLCAVDHDGMFCIVIYDVLILPVRQTISVLDPASFLVV